MQIVHEDNGKWYFWTETWVDRYGPYDSEQEAEKMFWKYSKELEGKRNIQQPKFKYIVLGNHPIFRRIDCKCVTYDEAINVKDGLLSVGYEVTINFNSLGNEKLKGLRNDYQQP